jgi:hypothetical protein
LARGVDIVFLTTEWANAFEAIEFDIEDLDACSDVGTEVGSEDCSNAVLVARSDEGSNAD